MRVADEHGLHLISLSHIIYAKGDGCCTTFYLLDPLESKKCHQLVTSRNLGYYRELLEHGFAQANQRVIVNLLYVMCITRSHEVEVLLCPHPIPVTTTYRKEFYEKLQVKKG